NVDLYGCVAFFFSSRRRHTRFSRDWSSDVCSSDLFSDSGLGNSTYSYTARVADTGGNQGTASSAYTITVATSAPGQTVSIVSARSEERRVGKEGSVRWLPRRSNSDDRTLQQRRLST